MSSIAEKPVEKKLSRVGRKPVEVPAGVEIRISDSEVVIKGPKGEIKQPLPLGIAVTFENKIIQIATQGNTENAVAIAGTIRALLSNHVQGVSAGFMKKLQLVGVGYRAQAAKGKDGCAVLNLTLGFSHPVSYVAPKGIEINAPSVTDIEVSGVDRQLVGQAAADIRGICGGLRKPEPYKGKGIRYADEVIVLKETKKK